MALTVRAFAILAISALLMELSMAATHNAGGPNGWDTSSDMQTWASSQTFSVGDSIVFQYSTFHGVSEVSKSDYDSCTGSNAIQTHSGGNTVITLSSPGKRYFICGTPGHCSQGMKLEVDTLAASAPPTASPTTPTVSSPAPEGSAPAPTESSPSSSPSPLLETPSGTPVLSGLSPIPPPSSSANKCSFTLAFSFALMMLFAL